MMLRLSPNADSATLLSVLSSAAADVQHMAPTLKNTARALDHDLARQISAIIGCPARAPSVHIENHSDWRLA
jgi:hypothetical protein